ARILQPLAERPQDPDPLAQFFLAILLDTNQGVYGDPFHACTLYLRAATPANPFMSQSSALAQHLQMSIVVGPDAPPLCSTEIDDRMPPVALRTDSAAPRAEARLDE